MKIDTEVELLARAGRKGLNVVSLSDLMNLTGKNYGTVRVSAHRLVRKGVLRPIKNKRGLWFNGLGNREPEGIIPRLYPEAYLSAETALSRYGLITFVPNTIIAGTPNKSEEIYTPYGTIQLFHIPQKYQTDIYEDTVTGIKTASREKALQDLFYLKRERGLSLGSVNISDQIDKEKLACLAKVLPTRQKRKLQAYLKHLS